MSPISMSQPEPLTMEKVLTLRRIAYDSYPEPSNSPDTHSECEDLQEAINRQRDISLQLV